MEQAWVVTTFPAVRPCRAAMRSATGRQPSAYGSTVVTSARERPSRSMGSGDMPLRARLYVAGGRFFAQRR